MWVWEGLLSIIESRIDDGSFGQRFPDTCPDGGAVCGTDRDRFCRVACVVVSGVFDLEFSEATHSFRFARDAVPSTLEILDFVEFCFQNVAEARHAGYHSFFKHHHLTFDREAGRDLFRQDVNAILARTGLVFELLEEGRIRRLAPVVLREVLSQATFSTGDANLDELLETARRKYLSPEESERRIGLDKLWDAFERIKTLEDADKRRGASLILDKAAPTSPKLRQALEREAKELTDLGNVLMIRHHEISREPVAASEHIDYLFGRMFSLVRLLLKMSGRGG